jgi:hypothetical protein
MKSILTRSVPRNLVEFNLESCPVENAASLCRHAALLEMNEERERERERERTREERDPLFFSGWLRRGVRV